MDAGAVLELFVPLLLGTAFGFYIGILPGLAGRIGILLGIPLAILFDPVGSVVFLFALHSVIHTSASIPAILFALPSSAGDAATVIDGHALACKGQAGRALGASLSASVFGGVFGASLFLVLIPVALPLLRLFGPPEMLALAAIGLVMIAVVAGRSVSIAICTAALGLCASMVGFDVATSTPRLTFGIPELIDGLNLAAIVGGLFVVPEMLERRSMPPNATSRAINTTLRDVALGMRETARHKALTLRASLYGVGIGALPGLGSSVAAWLAYGDASQSLRGPTKAGDGAIACVIAPEAANNSKEGGAMVPTLFFGIPGSTSMAIMMSAFVVVGLPIGPALFSTTPHIPVILAATVALSNIIAVPMFFAIVPALVRLTALHREQFVAIAIAFALFGACYQTLGLLTVAQFAAGAALGLVLKWLDWSRIPFLLGFVLGPIIEVSYLQTSQIWGWSALQRPGVWVLGVGAIFTLRAVTKFAIRSQAGVALRTDIAAVLAVAAVLCLVFVWDAFIDPQSNMVVLFAGLGAMACAVACVRMIGSGAVRASVNVRFDGLWTATLFVLAIGPFGLLLSGFLYIGLSLRQAGTSRILSAIIALAASVVQLFMLNIVVDPWSEPLVIGIIWDWIVFG